LPAIVYKVHGSGGKSILAACDLELCGSTLKAGKIEFLVSEGFYKGEEISKEALGKKLHEFENINLVGNRVVEIAISENLVSKENVLDLGKAKHVQIFKI